MTVSITQIAKELINMHMPIFYWNGTYYLTFQIYSIEETEDPDVYLIGNTRSKIYIRDSQGFHKILTRDMVVRHQITGKLNV